MSAVERTERHEAAAALLGIDGSPDRAAEAAAHLRASGRIAEAGQLLVRAAARARALGALADATTLLSEAVAALPDDPASALELADVLAWRGRPADAQAAFAHALPLIEASGDPAAVAEAHLRFAEWHYGPICQPAVSVAACRAALAVLDGAGLTAASYALSVLSVYAWCEAVAGDREEIHRVLGLLTDLDRRAAGRSAVGSPDGLDRAPLPCCGKGDSWMRCALGGAQRGDRDRRSGRPDLTYAALVNAAFGQAASGRDGTGVGDARSGRAAALAGHGMLAIEALVLVYRAWVLVRLGRLAEAAEAAAQARRAADRLDAPDLQAIVDAERGGLPCAPVSTLAAASICWHARCRCAVRPSVGPLARLQRAEALARQGQLDDAEAELAEVVFEPVREGDWPETLVIRMAAVEGLIAAGRGDSAKAQRLLDRGGRWLATADACGPGRAAIAVGDGRSRAARSSDWSCRPRSWRRSRRTWPRSRAVTEV